MRTIKVQVKWNRSQLSGQMDDKSLLGKVCADAEDFEKLKALSREALTRHITFLTQEGKDIPDWLRDGNYSLVFVMDPELLDFDYEDWNKKIDEDES